MAPHLFQSTLPREERQLCTSRLFIAVVFQSTLPREERHNRGGGWFYIMYISIHAPTRGATLILTLKRREKTYFNPRSHERSDKSPIILYHHFLRFQSTLPREERHVVSFFKTQGMDFNPRSHERSDVNYFSLTWVPLYFNPRSHERSDTTGEEDDFT